MAEAPLSERSKVHHHRDKTGALHQGLSGYFDQRAFSDLTIVCPSGKKLCCHRLVLAACSPRFSQLLHGGPLHSEELPVWGVDSDALELVIRYFYSGGLQINFNNVVPVYDAAQRLEVAGLATACEQFLNAVTHAGTVCALLQQAHQFRLEDLAGQCMLLIKSRFNEVVHSSDFALLKFPVLQRVLAFNQPFQPDSVLFGAAWTWVVADPDHAQHLEELLHLVRLPDAAVQQLLRGAGASASPAAPLQSSMPMSMQVAPPPGLLPLQLQLQMQVHQGAPSPSPRQFSLLPPTPPAQMPARAPTPIGPPVNLGGGGGSGGSGGGMRLDPLQMAHLQSLLGQQGGQGGHNLDIATALGQADSGNARAGPPLSAGAAMPEHQARQLLQQVVMSLVAGNTNMSGGPPSAGALGAGGGGFAPEFLVQLCQAAAAGGALQLLPAEGGPTGPPSLAAGATGGHGRGAMGGPVQDSPSNSSDTSGQAPVLRHPLQLQIQQQLQAVGSPRSQFQQLASPQQFPQLLGGAKAPGQQQGDDPARRRPRQQAHPVIKSMARLTVERDGRDASSPSTSHRQASASPPRSRRRDSAGAERDRAAPPLPHSAAAAAALPASQPMPPPPPSRSGGLPAGVSSERTLSIVPPGEIPHLKQEPSMSPAAAAGGPQGFSTHDHMGPLSSGPMSATTNSPGYLHAPAPGVPRGVCQLEGCYVDLTGLRDYHWRYKICDYHLKVSSVMRDGAPQRFCQQCGRFHLLTDFDGTRKSCRSRLQRHNARRRKRMEDGEEVDDGTPDDYDSPAAGPAGQTGPAALRVASDGSGGSGAAGAAGGGIAQQVRGAQFRSSGGSSHADGASAHPGLRIEDSPRDAPRDNMNSGMRSAGRGPTAMVTEDASAACDLARVVDDARRQRQRQQQRQLQQQLQQQQAQQQLQQQQQAPLQQLPQQAAWLPSVAASGPTAPSSLAFQAGAPFTAWKTPAGPPQALAAGPGAMGVGASWGLHMLAEAAHLGNEDGRSAVTREERPREGRQQAGREERAPPPLVADRERDEEALAAAAAREERTGPPALRESDREERAPAAREERPAPLPLPLRTERPDGERGSSPPSHGSRDEVVTRRDIAARTGDNDNDGERSSGGGGAGNGCSSLPSPGHAPALLPLGGPASRLPLPAPRAPQGEPAADPGPASGPDGSDRDGMLP